MKRYRTIVADPPWPHPDSGARTLSTAGHWEARHVGTRSVVPYERATVAAIKAMPIVRLAAEDSNLYLWTTNRFLRAAYGVVEAWGFRPSTLLTWCKAPRGIGFGGAYTITTEFVIFARRGSLAPLARCDTTWWQFKRPYDENGAIHSAKPDGFLDVVEQVSPGPYIELFARRARFGWDYWGDESLQTVEMPGTPEGG